MNDLTHLDSQGRIRMVDVGGKEAGDRRAVAEGFLAAGGDVIAALREGRTPKGNTLEAARLAGIAAAKRTWELVPLCHNIPLAHVQIDFELREDRVRIIAAAAAHAPTGVEMEALTAVSVAALTLYDMLKSLYRGMVISGVRLLEKEGGRSGHWKAAREETKG